MVTRTIVKRQNVFVLLMACLMALASVVCLLHTDVVGEAQVAHDGHRHTPASSGMHILLDLHCLVAILPVVMALVWLSLGVLYALTRFSTPVVPSFPPFIPPKALLRA